MNQSLLILTLSLCCVSVCQEYAYHFINESKSWCEAREYCRANYSDLATVSSQADADRLCGGAGHCPGAWIGLHHQEGTNMPWRWSQPRLEFHDSPEKRQSNSSRRTEPEGNCVYVDLNIRWQSAGCQNRKKFICYNSSNHSSILITDRKSWLGALQFCRKHYTDLVGPQEVKFYTYCWIGVFKDKWGWSDKSNSSYRNWHENETVLDNNWKQPQQQCARLGEQNKWMTDNCTEKHPFICYDDHMILIRENRTWEEALYYCRRNHRDLAVIRDHHQRRMVQERANMADSEYVWVGLHYTCFFEEWIWVDGRFVHDGNWDKSEPHECDLAGAMARGGENKWTGENSGRRYNFVCSISC